MLPDPFNTSEVKIQQGPEEITLLGIQYYDTYTEFATMNQKGQVIQTDIRVPLKIKKLTETGTLPEYKTEGAAGMDLYADLPDRWVIIPAGEWALISTGIAVSIPKGFEGQIRPRSGLALKFGVTVLNSPGTVDSDYTGEVGVILYNASREGCFRIDHGDRIAQLVICPVVKAELVIVEELTETDRGSGGFGSTGSK